jgi:hypothetical protein
VEESKVGKPSKSAIKRANKAKAKKEKELAEF